MIRKLRWIACLLLLAACRAAPTSTPPDTSSPASTQASSPAATRTSLPTATDLPPPSATATHTLIPIPTDTSTITNTPPPSDTPTITPTPTITNTPTPVVLLSTVNTTAQCRYGPGRAYLYKLGLEVGDEMVVAGRNERATWAYVSPAGRNFPCWVSAELLDIQGDLSSVPFHYTWLPKSPFYGPLRNVRASGGSGFVTLTWDPLKLRKGDDSGQGRYLVEAWVCEGSELTMIAISTDEPWVEIETGGSACSGARHAKVYGVEKHGYTPPVSVGW